jgi:hypothetical protein
MEVSATDALLFLLMSKRLFVAIDLPDSMRQLLADLDPDILLLRLT